VKRFENAAPAWLAQAPPCAFPIRVYPCHPWFLIILPSMILPICGLCSFRVNSCASW
jgi:hypothetical protein